MFGDDIELEGFDVGERRGVAEAGDAVVDGGAGSSVDGDLVAAEDAGIAVGEGDLECLLSDEAA